MQIVVDRDIEDPDYARLLMQTGRCGRFDISGGSFVEMTPEVEKAISEAQEKLDTLSNLIKK